MGLVAGGLEGRQHVARRPGSSSPGAGSRSGAFVRAVRLRRGRPRGSRRPTRARRVGTSPHSGSTSGRNVRRSERKRRVATRAWWTPSGSVSRRTIGSCWIRRTTEAAIARRTTSPAVAPDASSGTETSGDCEARGPSARTYFGVGSGAPAPAARNRSTIGVEQAGGVSSPISTSSSRNLAARRRPSSTDTSSSTMSASNLPWESRSSTRRRTVLRLRLWPELAPSGCTRERGRRPLRAVASRCRRR